MTHPQKNPKHCVTIPGWDVLCVTLRRSSLIYHNPANEGGALSLPQTKDLDRESPGVRSGHLGQLWTCTVQQRVKSHNGVQHVCGSKARGTIQGDVPGECSVSSFSLPSLSFSFQAKALICVSPRKVFIVIGPFLTVTLPDE